jgi:hypothetical protein
MSSAKGDPRLGPTSAVMERNMPLDCQPGWNVGEGLTELVSGLFEAPERFDIRVAAHQMGGGPGLSREGD